MYEQLELPLFTYHKRTVQIKFAIGGLLGRFIDLFNLLVKEPRTLWIYISM